MCVSYSYVYTILILDFGSLLCSSRLYLFDQRDNQISNIVKYYYNLKEQLKELNKNFKKNSIYLFIRNIIIICLLINLMHLYW